MISVRVAHTAQLDPGTLADARALLYAVFDDMTEHDWEHSLGGLHALAYEGGELVGHAARFDDLNDLIRQHNEWYPIERDLPMDLRTRDYVLINGRSYRREPLSPQWVLERFPVP